MHSAWRAFPRRGALTRARASAPLGISHARKAVLAEKRRDSGHDASAPPSGAFPSRRFARSLAGTTSAYGSTARIGPVSRPSSTASPGSFLVGLRAVPVSDGDGSRLTGTVPVRQAKKSFILTDGNGTV
ncbi:hypothetical protein MSAN_00437500 [Mycena sanguinolenta]|uniref:Uncharacterized protein n=1 Tax=Mycena sanguinolenta TaxID=230812 RepID=A0A8H6ZAH8_9AGAR|nr:hypothetical protein MSAN_00437500 [Mycena sanguinolenta]